jgi:hypothetical protein
MALGGKKERVVTVGRVPNGSADGRVIRVRGMTVPVPAEMNSFQARSLGRVCRSSHDVVWGRVNATLRLRAAEWAISRNGMPSRPGAQLPSRFGHAQQPVEGRIGHCTSRTESRDRGASTACCPLHVAHSAVASRGPRPLGISRNRSSMSRARKVPDP